MRLLAGDEGKLLSLGIFRSLSLHVRIAVNFGKACGLQIVEKVPVSEEPDTFFVSEDVLPVRGLDYARLLSPSHSVNSIKALKSANAGVAHVRCTCFIHVKPSEQHVREFPLVRVQGIEDIADQYAALSQCAVNPAQTSLYILIVWKEEEDVESERSIELFLIVQSGGVALA